MKVLSSVVFTAISVSLLLARSEFAFASDTKIAFPDYVSSDEQKAEFAANCVAVFQKAEKNAINKSNETYAQKQQALWADHLETRMPSKKKRKKLVKKKRKALSNNSGSGFMAGMADMKSQMQCQFPSEDLRSIG